MLTSTIINTIKWIDSLFEENTKSVFFSFNFHRGKAKNIEELLGLVVKASTDITRIKTVLDKNNDAKEIMEAFDLSKLLDEEFIVSFTTKLINYSQKITD